MIIIPLTRHGWLCSRVARRVHGQKAVLYIFIMCERFRPTYEKNGSFHDDLNDSPHKTNRQTEDDTTGRPT